MTIEEKLAAFVLGELQSTDLPAVALQMLEEGVESSELSALAGSPSNAHPSDLLDLWHRALRQIGRELPTRAEAGRTLRDHYAKRVASGSLAPQDGAAKIVWIDLASGRPTPLPDAIAAPLRGVAGDARNAPMRGDDGVPG